MTRNLKMLGLALVAVFAMSAVVASTASAIAFTSTAGAAIESRLNEKQPKIAVTGLEVSCETAEHSGEIPASSFTEITVTPAYTECKTGLGTTATVTGFGQHGEENPCSFVFHASGTADLECPSGGEVTVDAATCVIHIPPQNGLDKVVYTTVKTLSVDALTLHVELAKVKTNHTDGFLCPLASGGVSTTGVLDYTVELWATDEKGKKVPLTDHP